VCHPRVNLDSSGTTVLSLPARSYYEGDGSGRA